MLQDGGDGGVELQQGLAPQVLRPIMVFDTVRTLHTRVLEWAAEIHAFNIIQSQLRLRTGSDFVPLDPLCPVAQVGMAAVKELACHAQG